MRRLSGAGFNQIVSKNALGPHSPISAKDPTGGRKPSTPSAKQCGTCRRSAKPTACVVVSSGSTAFEWKTIKGQRTQAPENDDPSILEPVELASDAT
jgi:hypothetical protein